MELDTPVEAKLFGEESSESSNYFQFATTVQIPDEVLPSSGAQKMDMSEYQVFDMEEIEFHWDYPDLNMDTVFRPGIDTAFPTSTLINFEMGSVVRNPILIDDEEDKISAPTTPVSERRTENCRLPRRHSLEREYKTFLIMLKESCLKD